MTPSATLTPPGTRPCGHRHHVGSCPACMRAMLARWAEQNRDADRIRNERKAGGR